MIPRNERTNGLLHLFNKFAGREVVHSREMPDPAILEMDDIARANGLKLRVWFPGSVGTKDYRTDRVNAYVEKDADGKYRISSRFTIG